MGCPMLLWTRLKNVSESMEASTVLVNSNRSEGDRSDEALSIQTMATFKFGEKEFTSELVKKLDISANVELADGRKKVESSTYPDLQFYGPDAEKVHTPQHFQELHRIWSDLYSVPKLDDKKEKVKDSDGNTVYVQPNVQEFMARALVQAVTQKLSAGFRLQLIAKAEGPMGLVKKQVDAVMSNPATSAGLSREVWTSHFVEMFRKAGVLPKVETA